MKLGDDTHYLDELDYPYDNTEPKMENLCLPDRLSVGSEPLPY